MSAICVLCKKSFSTRFNLNKHRKIVHNLGPTVVSYDQSKWNFKCLEKDCNNSFQHNIDLRNHLSRNHDLNMETETMEFPNREEFLAWKNLIEKTDKSSYAVSRTSKSKDIPVTYYLCNRSGNFRSTRSTNKRRPKIQGSCKLNRHCTSMIKVVKGRTLSVTWIKTHYGHSSDIQHIRLSKMEKSVIASKLILGVPPSRILDSYRDKTGEDMNREALVTRKDIQNIKNSYHINAEGVKHDNDAVSVELWVEQPRQDQPTTVFLYKKQVVEDDVYKLCMKSTERVTKPDVPRQNFSSKVINTMTKLLNADRNILDKEIILQIKCHLDSIDKLIDLPSSSSHAFIPINQNEAENKKVDKQDRFFSIRKTNKSQKIDCKRLMDSEIVEINKNV